VFGEGPYLSRAWADIAVDECEASSRSTGKSRVVEGASTSDQEDDKQGYESDELSDEDETDPFLQALLHPNEHARRLLEVRTRVAGLCHISAIMTGAHIEVKHLLQFVIESFGLLRDAGLMQDSLILLADDPERVEVVQAVEIDVEEIKTLGNNWITSSIGSQRESHDKMYQAAQELFGPLRLTDIYIDTPDLHDSDRNEQIKRFVTLLAFATASYAGSHCHSLFERSPEPGGAGMGICHGISIRSRRFACLDQYIGGPVWVLGSSDYREGSGKLLSITTEQFDDLWGPVTGLVESYSSDTHGHTRTIALQTEGGFLSKTRSGHSFHLSLKDEIPVHWTPAQHDERSLPGTPFDSSFHLKATMLIGFGEQEEDSARHRRPAITSRCFETNPNCKLNARAYASSIEACNFEYVGTARRKWVIDTKAVNVAGGWAGSSIGTTRTLKLRPATSWKASMLQYCNEPGRPIKSLMRLRVGLARSVCTGNARRVSLFEALKLAFPGQQETIKHLVRSANTDESSR
jgi:hypothetical protein